MSKEELGTLVILLLGAAIIVHVWFGI